GYVWRRKSNAGSKGSGEMVERSEKRTTDSFAGASGARYAREAAAGRCQPAGRDRILLRRDNRFGACLFRRADTRGRDLSWWCGESKTGRSEADQGEAVSPARRRGRIDVTRGSSKIPGSAG